MFKSAAAAAPQKQAEKPMNTQTEKTSEGRSSTSDSQPVGEGPAGLAAEDEGSPAQQASTPDEERIQLVAYQLWLDRGCPHGSPEIDWIEAVRICSTPERQQ